MYQSDDSVLCNTNRVAVISQGIDRLTRLVVMYMYLKEKTQLACALRKGIVTTQRHALCICHVDRCKTPSGLHINQAKRKHFNRNGHLPNQEIR